MIAPAAFGSIREVTARQTARAKADHRAGHTPRVRAARRISVGFNRASNMAVEQRPARSHSLAAAAHCQRYAH